MKLDFNRGEAWTMQMANMVKQWWSVRPGENWKSEASPMEIIQRVKPGLTHLLIEWSGGEILTLYIIGSGEERWWREEGGSRLQIDACINTYSVFESFACSRVNTPHVAVTFVDDVYTRKCFSESEGIRFGAPRTKGTAVNEWVHSFVDFCLIPLSTTCSVDVPATNL